jgi:nucleotide-binding universal stress UspA family protein
MLTRILIPIDFTARAGEAARYAGALAAHFGAELVLAHVIEPAHFDFSMVDPPHELLQSVTESTRRRMQLQLDEFAGADLDGIRVSRLLLDGDPADQILCAARREKADLIVMPTRGLSRMRHFLIGSVTAKVLHDAPVPVWTGVHLHHHANFPEFRFASILCAIDFGSQAGAVIRHAARLAQEFSARLTVMHVASPNSLGVRQRIEALLAPLRVDAEILVEAGEPHKVVSATAGKMHADLLVIGRACSTGMMGRLREQAYGIVRDSPCPVLSV